MNNLKIVAIDRDLEAIKKARDSIYFKQGRLIPIHGSMSQIGELLKDCNIDKFDVALFDLGFCTNQVSTKFWIIIQVKNSVHGFSFMNNGSLDMRMNRKNTKDLNAYAIVNWFSEKELIRILYEVTMIDSFYLEC